METISFLMFSHHGPGNAHFSGQTFGPMSKADAREVVRLMESLGPFFPQAHPPGRSKAVEVVDKDLVSRQRDILAPSVFSSADTLSRALGYKTNEVAKALARRKGNKEATATLRGVTFRYLAEAPD